MALATEGGCTYFGLAPGHQNLNTEKAGCQGLDEGAYFGPLGFTNGCSDLTTLSLPHLTHNIINTQFSHHRVLLLLAFQILSVFTISSIEICALHLNLPRMGAPILMEDSEPRSVKDRQSPLPNV